MLLMDEQIGLNHLSIIRWELLIGYFVGDAEVEIDWLNETLHINEKEQEKAKFHLRRTINGSNKYSILRED